MPELKQLKKQISDKAHDLQTLAARIARNNAIIADYDEQSVRCARLMADAQKQRNQAVFALMNQLSHRRFMHYMRKYHGWK